MTHFIALLDHQPHEDRTRYRVFRLKRSVPTELGYTEYIQHNALTQVDREARLQGSIYNLIIQKDGEYEHREVADLVEAAEEKELGIHIIE